MNLLAATLAVRLATGFLLGHAAAVALAITGTEAAANLALHSPIAAPLVRRGTTMLVATHAARGATIACVAAPADTIGTVRGVNVGVAVKSVAVLLDARWHRMRDAPAAWAALARAGMQFANWENCGVKLEGPPSPASLLVPDARGASDNIDDGNPGTTYRPVPRRYGRATIAAMLGPRGYAQRGLSIHLSIFADGARRALVMQGLVTPGAVTPGRAARQPAGKRPGFIALYLER